MTVKDRNLAEEQAVGGDVDLSIMDGLLAIRKPGNPDPRKKIIAIYIDSTGKLMEKMRSSLETGDADSLRKAAHTLKSSSMNVGATVFASLCCDMEQAAVSRDLGYAGALMERCETKYKQAIDFLTEAMTHM